MTKEEKYRQEMIALGTWHTAFAPMVHDLAILERELSRTRAAWKKTAPPGQAPSALDPHYALIRQQSRDIMALREALGLTPRALRRMKGTGTSEGTHEDPLPGTVLSLVRDKYGT